MNTKALSSVAKAVLAGVNGGFLPADTVFTPDDARPWPVVLLTAIGAWFAAIPLFLLLGMVFGDAVFSEAGPYLFGGMALAAAIGILRTKDLPLFVEQLAVPVLIVGLTLLAVGCFKDMGKSGGAWGMLAVVFGVATAIRSAWLRILLGCAAAGLMYQALWPSWNWQHSQLDGLISLHALLIAWLLALWLQKTRVNIAAAIENLATGWLISTLVGFAWIAGATFLLSGTMGFESLGHMRAWNPGSGYPREQALAIQFVSCSLVLTAAFLSARSWRGLRHPLFVVVATAFAALSGFLPMLGAPLLAMAITAITHRWRLASASAIASAWIVGSFYYQLQWTLSEKALVLVSISLALGTATLAAQDRRHLEIAKPRRKVGDTAKHPVHPFTSLRTWAVLAGSLATLLAINLGIWQKEDLISRGKPMYLALAPVDPRSLMQGDYMRLRFATLNTRHLPPPEAMMGKRPLVVIKLDAHDVATVLREHDPDHRLAADESLLELSPKNGDWVVVTDAWFFSEGEGERWQKAKYGEFRVLPDGKALLVGMADEALHPIAAGNPR